MAHRMAKYLGSRMECSMANWRAHQKAKYTGVRMENLRENQMAKYSGTCWEYHLG
jgi:hypothetical protein